MKRIIGIFSFVLVVGIMFFNVNISPKSKTDVDLAGIIASNLANAETGYNNCFWTGWSRDECSQPPYIPKMYCESSLMTLCN